MGSLVHGALYRLHRDLQFHKANSLEDVLSFYHTEWEKQWTDDILVVKGEYDSSNYRSMGEKYLRDYYGHYAPFDEMRIIDLETQEFVNLPDGSKYHVRIDKVSFTENIYYICDYKTNLKMKGMSSPASISLPERGSWIATDLWQTLPLYHLISFPSLLLTIRSRRSISP